MSFRMLHDEVAAVEAALQQSLDAGRALAFDFFAGAAVGAAAAIRRRAFSGS